MFKQLTFIIFLLIASLQTFAQQDNQAEIKQQEAILFSSFKNFNKEELLLVKEYIKALKKVTLYMDKYFSLMTCKEDSNPALVPLRIKADKFGLIVGTLKNSYNFIQNIHKQLCVLSSLVQNENLLEYYEYEIFPFDEGKSLRYTAELAAKMLDEIRKVQAS